MKISDSKMYKIISFDKEYYGTPKAIVDEMSWFDKGRPVGDSGHVKNNREYVKLVAERLFLSDDEMKELIDECDLLKFLNEKGFITIEKAN